jgi:hypothetical protein
VGGYREALVAAGADVIDFNEFGSYQGDWWALVRYRGEVGWIHGSYGSCSGCDSFEAEFGFSDRESPEYPAKLAAFGTTYLGTLMTHAQALEHAKRNLEWDSDAQEMVDWMTSIKGKTLEQTVFRLSGRDV